MRKIIVSEIVSADGYFSGADGDIEWFVLCEDFFRYVRDTLDAADTILFGRKTFLELAGYWPTELAENEDPVITHKMNNLEKIVFSRNLEYASWKNSVIQRELDAELISGLKRMPGKDMLVLGSGSVVSQLAGWDLVDEYRFVLCPLTLGRGRSVLGEQTVPLRFRLKSAQPFSCGSVLLTYLPFRTA